MTTINEVTVKKYISTIAPCLKLNKRCRHKKISNAAIKTPGGYMCQL